jgi:hypothetical protein
LYVLERIELSKRTVFLILSNRTQYHLHCILQETARAGADEMLLGCQAPRRKLSNTTTSTDTDISVLKYRPLFEIYESLLLEMSRMLFIIIPVFGTRDLTATHRHLLEL